MSAWRWMLGALVALMAGQVLAQYDNGYDYSGYGYNSGDRTFECKSSGYSPTYCRVDTRYGITLIRRISNSECVQGQSWGFDDRGVWVSNGCQARFALGGRHDTGHDNGYGNCNGNGHGGYDTRTIPRESARTPERYCPF